MKKLLASVAISFALIISTFGQTISGNPAFDEITSIQRILLQASEEVLYAENTLEMEIVHLEVDLVLGKDYKYMYRDLSKGWIYLMYAEGENMMVNDLDMKILKQNAYTEEWEEVISDTREAFGAMCLVEVTESTRYAIGIKVAEYATGFSGCHYFLIIAHQRP